jgi:hypothetical protein
VSENGIDVSATSLDRVAIRNISIIATTTAANGISATGFRSLTIESCHVDGGANAFIIAGTGLSTAVIVDSAAEASIYGFIIQSRAVMVRCRAHRNASVGLYVGVGISSDGVLSAVDFVASGNGDGVAVVSNDPAHNVMASLDRALLSDNSGTGAYTDQAAGAGQDAFLWVSNSTSFRNGTYGFAQTGLSYFGSRNNNLVAANGILDATGTISPVAAH